MTKLEKLAKQLNDNFTSALRGAFEKKFEVELETHISLVSLVYVSSRRDGADFTPEQAAWLVAYEAGYLDCLNQARVAAA